MIGMPSSEKAAVNRRSSDASRDSMTARSREASGLRLLQHRFEYRPQNLFARKS
jgi:hypothetical protein